MVELASENTPADSLTLMLRKLADDIDDGNYGDCSGAAIALDSNESLELFGFGEGCQSNHSAIVLFSRATYKLLGDIDG